MMIHPSLSGEDSETQPDEEEEEEEEKVSAPEVELPQDHLAVDGKV